MAMIKVQHKRYGTISKVDGEQLVDMYDGERWKMENMKIIEEETTEVQD